MRRHGIAAVAVVVLMMAGVMPAGASESRPGGGGDPASGADLAMTVVGPTDSPDRGDTFPVTVRVSNVGTEDVSDVSLSTYLSGSFDLSTITSSPSMTCETGEYDNLTCTQPSLAVGDSASVTLTLTRTMAREAWLDWWISSSSSESDYDNNYGGLYFEPDRSNPADVEVKVTAPEQPEVGEEFVYSAVVTNRGPEIARDVRFSQSLSDGVDYVSVASSDPDDDCVLHEEVYDAEGVEGGPYTYTEVRCTLGNMQFAAQTTIKVTAVRNDPHELWSSAWVSTTSYDDDYENDWSDASTAGHPSVTSNLVMTFTGDEQDLLVGDDGSYTFEITNLGPVPATDAMFDTWLPQELSLRALTPGRESDVCEQNEYQGISCTLGPLAVGETTTVTVDVTRVRAREYWMGGSVWSSNYDPEYENNYVEFEGKPDTSVPADLKVNIEGPEDPAVGSTFDYTITVTNRGPREATAVSMAAPLPDGVDFVSATSPDDSDVCSLFEESYDDEGMKAPDGGTAQYTYRELRCELGTLVPAEAATITLTVTRTTEYELWASAWASTASYDENYDNDYDSVGSFGDPVPACGVPVEDDEGGVAVCSDSASGGSADKGSYAVTSEPGKRWLKTGKGNDDVTIRIPTSSKKHRKLFVDAGRGRDSITLVLAPGAGNVTVILKGGKGRDRIEVVAPRPGKRFKLRMWGGAGTDTCSAALGDRHRSRAC